MDGNGQFSVRLVFCVIEQFLEQLGIEQADKTVNAGIDGAGCDKKRCLFIGQLLKSEPFPHPEHHTQFRGKSRIYNGMQRAEHAARCFDRQITESPPVGRSVIERIF